MTQAQRTVVEATAAGMAELVERYADPFYVHLSAAAPEAAGASLLPQDIVPTGRPAGQVDLSVSRPASDRGTLGGYVKYGSELTRRYALSDDRDESTQYTFPFVAVCE